MSGERFDALTALRGVTLASFGSERYGGAAVDAGTDPQPVAVDVPDEFAAFFRAEMPRLTGYCTGLLADRDAGADIAQEALTRTYARWITVRDPHAYAYLVATNLVRRAWRHQAEDRAAFVAAGRRMAISSPAVDPSLRDLVESLPERLRVPTLLHYYADLPIEEVARLLHRPAGTVRRWLHEARHQLTLDLQEQ